MSTGLRAHARKLAKAILTLDTVMRLGDAKWTSIRGALLAGSGLHTDWGEALDMERAKLRSALDDERLQEHDEEGTRKLPFPTHIRLAWWLDALRPGCSKRILQYSSGD